jgi:hypothetical protein
VNELTRDAVKQLVAERIKSADAEGRKRYGTERLITFKQEEAYRLVHQDHFGLSNVDAAEVAGTTEQSITQKLTRLAAVAPQLFPVLTPLQSKIYRMFMEGYTVREIAEFFGVIERGIKRVLTLLHKDKQIYFRSDSGCRRRYRSSMDNDVKEVW